jgi:hypothetical protein
VAERVLTLRELNRATLARQLLLERKRLGPGRVIEHLVGMQAQSAQAPYVGIWTRTESFRRASLERLLVRGDVIRSRVMRQTLHVVTRRDYGLIRAAMSTMNFPWESASAKRLAPKIRALAADGGVTAAEAYEYLERELGLTGREARYAWQYGRVAGHVAHHHEDALWAGRQTGRFVALDEPETHDPVEARAEMMRRYLAAFGPASRRDMTAWSMQHAPEIALALERLELRRFRDEQGRELLDVPRAPLPDPDTPAPPRFLPTWDAILLVHARRTGVLPEEHRPKVFSVRNPHSSPTFLVDGRVAGTWKHEKGAIRLEPFGRLDASARRELRSEADRLAEFHA